ncbi:hypothetical protein [uncultured Brevundimonas sp.]|uniref:hypothetical protein n=1 Tax=uncultured Brevundimonas sp. TaxID=213418 RepID=UPI0030EEFB75
MQSQPKALLPKPVCNALEAAGFLLTPKRTEAFIQFSRAVRVAIEEARAAIARLDHVMKRRAG